jgi:rhomboid protease GluP
MYSSAMGASIAFCFRSWRLPILTLSPTLLLTLVAQFYPAVFSSLRRDPRALAEGEWWRLLSPVLVQADFLLSTGRWRAIAVLVLVAALLAISERTFGAARSFVLYCTGALIGHGVGEFWQPYSSGCSVAGCGVLGGMAAWLLPAGPVQVRIGAAVVLALAVIATVSEDIHGPPLLAGAILGVGLLRSAPLPPALRRPPPNVDGGLA